MVGKAVNSISLLFKILSQITPNLTKAILNIFFCLGVCGFYTLYIQSIGSEIGGIYIDSLFT